MRFSLFATVLASAATLSCSDPNPAPPTAFINAQLGPGTDVNVNGAAQCKLTTQPWLQLGKSDALVENATTQSSANIGVTCSVVPEGDGFRIAASATLSPGGTVSLTGLLRAGGPQTGITGSFTRADTGGTFRDKNCTVEYKSKDMGVSPGTVWGFMTCPNASQLGTENRTCLATAEFKFGNCEK